MTTAVKEPMAKKRTERTEGKEPPTVAVKIDRALANRARIIAADKGVDLADYLSESLRGTIDRDWAKVIRKADAEGGGK